MYAALIIDIIKSRSYSVQDREFIQNHIIEICKKLNNVYRNGIVRNVEFSAGDEIQGLFENPAAAYLYFRLFSMLLYPVKIRAGIGCGTWDVKIENEGTSAQDGQAYHRARKAIHEAAKQKQYPILLYSGNWLDEAINSLIGAAAGLHNKMSTYQNMLLLLTELHYPLTQGSCMNLNLLHDVLNLLEASLTLSHMNNYDLEHVPHGGISIIEPVDVDREESAFYITGGQARGMPTNLAAIMQVSRQSVDRSLKAAGIYASRNITISALRMIARSIR